MIERAIEAIDEALLGGFISNHVAEWRDLEFKRQRRFDNFMRIGIAGRTYADIGAIDGATEPRCC